MLKNNEIEILKYTNCQFFTHKKYVEKRIETILLRISERRAEI